MVSSYNTEIENSTTIAKIFFLYWGQMSEHKTNVNERERGQKYEPRSLKFMN